MSSEASLKIGVDRLSLYYFGGNLDDIRIYNRELGPGEIMALNNENPLLSIQTPALLAFSNDILEMPVNVNNLQPDQKIYSFRFDCNYDGQKLHFQDFNTQGTMAEYGKIQGNQLPDKLSFTWTGQNPLGGSGTILKLRFRALEEGFTIPVLTNCFFNADTVRNIQNGVITIQGMPTGLSDPSAKSIEIYPNPANTILFFRNLTGNTRISIYDLQGRELISRVITDNQVDISDLEYGIYTVRIEDARATITRKLIKQ